MTAPPKHRPTNGGRIVLLAWMTAIFVFLYLPILVIVIYSFTAYLDPTVFLPMLSVFAFCQ